MNEAHAATSHPLNQDNSTVMPAKERAHAIRRARRALKALADHPGASRKQLGKARERLNDCYRLSDPDAVWAAAQAIETAGVKLPLFVPCLLMGILVGNLWSALAPADAQVSRTPGLNVISDFSLSVFLAMSLMSLQLWTLAGLGTMILAALVLQVGLAVAFILFAVFPLMGGAYRAAVLSAGFAGFSLGATPTAIANMTAVAKRYGPSPTAFVILPLVSAFFVDLANAAAIRLFLSL